MARGVCIPLILVHSVKRTTLRSDGHVDNRMDTGAHPTELTLNTRRGIQRQV